MESANMDWIKMSDGAIAEQIAAFIKHIRLQQNKSQSDLANEAGITRRTLSAFESGKKNISMVSLIQLLRALKCLHLLDGFEIKTQISPLQLAKVEHEKRKRASSDKQVISKPKSNW